MPLLPWQENELTFGGDTRLHYHLEDRGPFVIPHGYFYDTTTKTIASTTTAYALALNTTVYSKGVEIVDNSKITVAAPGVYNIQFSAQLQNAGAQEHDVEIWLSKNGSNVADSNTIVGVGASHGGVPGHEVAAWNLFIALNRNDYVELYWRASSTDVSMAYSAAAASPTRPAVPSLIVSANLVSI